ncbi:Lariat debranching enzyme [Arachis hypogaea]|nr:Lariat debranching enzyme [Arachis hypogaea]
MDDCCQWVRSRLQQRGCKPFEFVKTALCYDPSQSNFHGSFAGISLFSIANSKLTIVHLDLWLKMIS